MQNDSIFPLAAALISNLLAQGAKVFSHYYRTGEWSLKEVLASGGFPSSHSSTVTSLTIAVGMQEGFDSALFAVAAVFAFIVMYDACHVRYYTGKNIELTQRLVTDLQEMTGLKFSDPVYQEKLKTVLGHKLVEVFGGFIVGLIIPFLLSPFFIH